MYNDLHEAKKQKQDNEYLIGRILKGERSPLLKLVIIQKTPTEFGQMWADQRENFEDEDKSKILTDEEFDLQMKAFDDLDLTMVDGEYYFVVGVFRYINGEPRFQPLDNLLLANAASGDPYP